MLEGTDTLMHKLSKDVRLKYDKASDNYYLFCIKTGKHARLNAMSYEILSLLEKGMDKCSIAASVLENYDIDHATCSKDIENFLKFLHENGMIYSLD
jgi:hypothetical protein